MDEHSAKILGAQAKIEMRQLQLLQDYLLELEPALQAASAVKVEAAGEGGHGRKGGSTA